MTRDKQYLLSKHRGSCKVWSLKTGELLHSTEEFPESCRKIYLSADEKMVYGVEKSSVYFWDFPSLKLRKKSGESPAKRHLDTIRVFPGAVMMEDNEDERCKEGLIEEVVEDPYRKRLYLARGKYGSRCYWDLEEDQWNSSRDSWYWGAEGLGMNRFAVSGDGEILVGSYDNRIWHVSEQSESYSDHRPYYKVWQLSADHVYSSGNRANIPRELFSFSIDDVNRRSQSKKPSKKVIAWTVSHDGQVLYLAYSGGDNGNREIEQWTIDGSKSLGLMEGHKASTAILAMRPDDKVLASFGSEREIEFWEPSTRTELHRIKDDDKITSFRFSADSTLLITCSRDNKTIQIWGRPGVLD
ncbi:MAG: WD40 repeat domain-containing protein [Cyanophyceae cyanobacterium]